MLPLLLPDSSSCRLRVDAPPGGRNRRLGRGAKVGGQGGNVKEQGNGVGVQENRVREGNPSLSLSDQIAALSHLVYLCQVGNKNFK